MKRIIVLILIVIMTISTLAGCMSPQELSSIFDDNNELLDNETKMENVINDVEHSSGEQGQANSQSTNGQHSISGEQETTESFEETKIEIKQEPEKIENTWLFQNEDNYIAQLIANTECCGYQYIVNDNRTEYEILESDDCISIKRNTSNGSITWIYIDGLSIYLKDKSYSTEECNAYKNINYSGVSILERGIKTQYEIMDLHQLPEFRKTDAANIDGRQYDIYVASVGNENARDCNYNVYKLKYSVEQDGEIKTYSGEYFDYENNTYNFFSGPGLDDYTDWKLDETRKQLISDEGGQTQKVEVTDVIFHAANENLDALLKVYVDTERERIDRFRVERPTGVTIEFKALYSGTIENVQFSKLQTIDAMSVFDAKLSNSLLLQELKIEYEYRSILNEEKLQEKLLNIQFPIKFGK